uniref:Neur_chan_LBD domain-containing protein n=1 Tax=Gongylonema pulchrum TaxID=637853 RepID=A0A183DFG5_9BILA
LSVGNIYVELKNDFRTDFSTPWSSSWMERKYYREFYNLTSDPYTVLLYLTLVEKWDWVQEIP